MVIGFIIMLSLTAGMSAYLFEIGKNLYSKNIPLYVVLYLTAIFSSICIIIRESHWVDMAIRVILVFVLSAASYVDYEKKVIPNVLLLFLTACGIVYYIGLFVLYKRDALYLIAGKLFTGFGFLAGFLLVALLSKGIGGGDIKIIALIGCIVEYSLTVSTLLYALILSMLFSIILLLLKKKQKKDEIPFCPFLYIGYIFTMFLYYI